MAREAADDQAAERESALESFAKGGGDNPGEGVSSLPATVFQAPAERVFGAQKVAVLRDEGKVLVKLKALAAAAGDDWYYRWPVRDKKTGKTSWVEGPSIKLANDLARLYGNNEIETRVMDLGDSWLIYARFTDYETGAAQTRPYQQRKSQRSMDTDRDRARDIAFQIGISKAIRNVVCNSLQTFADFAFEQAREAIVVKIGQKLEEYRETTARKLTAHVDLKRVEAVVGRTKDEWLAPDIAKIIAMMKAVQDGMATLEETFPPLAAAQAKAEPAAAQLDEFAKTSDSAVTGETAADAAAESGVPPDPNSAANPVTVAYERGAQSRRDGALLKALPGEYRSEDRSAEAAAWKNGWKHEDKRLAAAASDFPGDRPLV